MAIGVGEIINTVVSTLITSVLFYIVLKIMKDDRDFLKVFIVVLIANIVTIFLPYLSMLGIPIPWYVYLIMSVIATLFIYKYGLDLTWLRTIILVILTPIIAILIGLILAFLGIGAILGLSFLT